MLSCKDVAARASDLIDGELSGWQAFRMRLHLAMCRGCANFIRQIRTTRDLTDALPEPAPAPQADAPRIALILSQLRDPPRDN